MVRNTAMGSREVTRRHLGVPNRSLAITARLDVYLRVKCADLS